MNNIIYAIDDDPYCLWESDTKEATASFLKSIDHDYFEYIAKRSSVDLDDREYGLRAAASMRIALFHGGETLFLLIGALLQAPSCPHAWIGQCSTEKLRDVIERINAGKPFLLQNKYVSNVSWLDISREVLRPCPPSTPAFFQTVESFAGFWELLALNHTDQSLIDEYNSLKHGFRVAHGGFEAKIGGEGEMTSLGSSKWGATFRTIKKFEADTKGNRSRQSILTSVNWDAEAVAHSLLLVAYSIRNVAAYLGIFNRQLGWDFRIPQAEVFAVASKRVALQSMSISMAPPVFQATTKEQLMVEIKKTSVKRLVRALRSVMDGRRKADGTTAIEQPPC